jgi:hypothetical protein
MPSKKAKRPLEEIYGGTAVSASPSYCKVYQNIKIPRNYDRECILAASPSLHLYNF